MAIKLGSDSLSLLFNPNWYAMKGMFYSSDSWLMTLTCSASDGKIIEPSDSFTQALQWMRFIFFSICPQRLLFSSIDFLFLLILLVLVTQRFISKFFSRRGNTSSSSINEPLLENHRIHVKFTSWFIFNLISTAFLAVAYVSLSILVFIGGRSQQTPWIQTETTFRIVQAITQIAILFLVAHEKRFHATTHPMSLRVYWAAHFVLVLCFNISAITRLVSVHEGFDPYVKMDDIVYFICLPFSAFLLAVATEGSSGIIVIVSLKMVSTHEHN